MSHRKLARGRLSQSCISRAVTEVLEQRCLITGSPYEDRGYVSIIVDNTVWSSVSANVVQLQQDLIGDGWNGVEVHDDAPRMDDEHYVWRDFTGVPSPVTNSTYQSGKKAQYAADIQSVKDMIAGDADTADTSGSELKQVILIGHVTVPYRLQQL
jgi:hypothetical protein